MNNVKKGYLRDRELLEELERCKALNTYQITSLIFEGKSGLRKAQQRLKKLHDNKKVRRTRVSLDEPFTYYIHNATGRFEHLIALNWVYVWLLRRLANWESLWCWDYEPSYGFIRPDAFFGVRNSVLNEVRFTFVEMDLSNNVWDKTEKYNRLYSEGRYQDNYWVKYAKAFPAILCVTDRLPRLKLIEKSIQEENKNGLNFKVVLLDDIRGYPYVAGVN